MTIDLVTVRNTQTGKVGTVKRRVFENHRLMSPEVFIEVDPGSKPYVAELYKSRSVSEYVASRPVETVEEETENEVVDYTDPEDEETK